MLNSPQRKAKATARPVRISGVVMISVCCRLSAAVVRSSPVVHGKQPVQAGAVEDRLVGGDRVVAGDEDDQAADQEGEHGREQRDDDAAALHVGRQPRGRGGGRRLGPAPRRRAPGPPGSTGSGPLTPRASRRRPPPVIAIPSSSSDDVGRELADDLALVDDDDPVGERADLLELERHEQDPAAGVALGDQAAVDELDGARRRGRASAGRRRARAGCRRSRAR